MTITTNDAIWKFATQTQVSDASTSAVTDGSKSVAADMDDWSNADDAAVATFALAAAFGTAPDVRSAIHLYAMLKDFQSTNDMPIPDANFDGIYLGSFTVDNVTATQYLVLPDAPIPSVETSQTIEFYIENGCGQTLSAGWDLWITPKTYGPHA